MIKTKKEIMGYVEKEMEKSSEIPDITIESFNASVSSTCMACILEALIDIRDVLILDRREKQYGYNPPVS